MTEPRQEALVRIISQNMAGPMTGAEIGVAKGATSAVLLRTFPRLRLYMVDLWNTIAGEISESEQKRRMFEADRGVAFAADRRIIVRDASVSAAQALASVDFNFVFIDADHTRESVQADSIAWYRRIADGGLMLWHDYGPRSTYPGVIEAVDAFCLSLGKLPNLDEKGRIGWIQKA